MLHRGLHVVENVEKLAAAVVHHDVAVPESGAANLVANTEQDNQAAVQLAFAEGMKKGNELAMKVIAEALIREVAQRQADIKAGTAYNGQKYVTGVTPEVSPQHVEHVEEPKIKVERVVPQNNNPNGRLYPVSYGDPPFDDPNANILIHQQLQEKNLPPKYGGGKKLVKTPGSRETMGFIHSIPKAFRDPVAWLILGFYFEGSTTDRTRAPDACIDPKLLLPPQLLPQINGADGKPVRVPNSVETRKWLSKYPPDHQFYLLLAMIMLYEKALRFQQNNGGMR